MSARALVARPGRGRKQHFATLSDGTVWLAVCDRVEIPVAGAVVSASNDWTAWLQAAQDLDSPLCSLCRRPLLVAALALHEVADVRASNLVRDRLEAEVARLSAWYDLAAGELRRIREEREERRVARFERRMEKLRHDAALDAWEERQQAPTHRLLAERLDELAVRIEAVR